MIRMNLKLVEAGSKNLRTAVKYTMQLGMERQQVQTRKQ